MSSYQIVLPVVVSTNLRNHKMDSLRHNSQRIVSRDGKVLSELPRESIILLSLGLVFKLGTTGAGHSPAPSAQERVQSTCLETRTVLSCAM